jgi:hypothetical protein
MPTPAATGEPPTAPPAGETPDWLRELAPPEEMPTPAAAGEPPTAPLADETPDWLQELAAAQAASPVTTNDPSPIPSPADALAALEDSEAPAWLAELQNGAGPSATPPSDGEGAEPPPFEQDPLADLGELARAEIPGWLEALRPRAEAGATLTEAEPLETEGLLEGLRGVLAPNPVTAAPQSDEYVQPVEAGEATLARAQLLQSLLTQPPKAVQPESIKRGLSPLDRLQRWVAAAVLLIPAVVLAWHRLGLNPPLPRLAQPLGSESVERLHRTIESVGSEDTVLVAFEYGPAEADELNVVATPILRHLLDREANIVVTSTQPEGVATAGMMWNDLAIPGKELEPYRSAGYRPGGATGVAQLMAVAEPQPTLILVLTAQAAPLRWWIEQARTRRQGSLPVIAGVSAALEATASPYLDVKAGQLSGMLIGLNGAAAYGAPYGAGEREITAQLDALVVGHVMLAVWILAGAVFHAPGGLLRRKT